MLTVLSSMPTGSKALEEAEVVVVDRPSRIRMEAKHGAIALTHSGGEITRTLLRAKAKERQREIKGF